MAFNGSGTFLINTAGQPVVAGTVISSTAFNALTADLATGLSTVITKDGQTTVTANIPMSTYKFTGLGVGSAATDSANLSQVQSTVTKLLTSVSGTDTITAVGAPVVAAYAAGQMFYFVATGDNTGAVTLNIDSLGAKAVTRDGSVALAAGDIKSGEVVVVVYDGTRFQVVSQLNSAGDARFANVSIASSLYVGGVSTFVGNAGFSANVSIASALSVGGVAAITGATTIGGNLTLNGGTANGVLYLNGSKVATSGTALVFDGTNLGIGTSSPQAKLVASNGGANGFELDPANGFISAFNRSTSAWTKITTRASSYTFNLSNTNDAVNIDASGNLLVGTTSPLYSTAGRGLLEVNGSSSALCALKINNTAGGYLFHTGTDLLLVNAVSGALRFDTNNTERARITSDGDLLVGTTTAGAGAGFGTKTAVDAGSGDGGLYKTSNSTGAFALRVWNSGTTGDNLIVGFATETAYTGRGSISYNRTAGLVAYNTTSDYRAKDIIGPVQDSGATIDALKVYEGQMKGATQSRPMLVAHEAQEHAPYAVTGEKDAVNEDGTPKYQQMDVSALVPLLLAEIQSLRARVAQLETK
jgi:hypothetical protein